VTPLKAEYIGADQLPFFVFRLQHCGGPYIPRSQFIQDLGSQMSNLGGDRYKASGSGSDEIQEYLFG
jgi:hypothetical protein